MTKPRYKGTTQTEIAKLVGVTSGVVSAVLNGKAEERRISPKTVTQVMRLAQELNYVPNRLAQGLKQQLTYTIGIIFVNFYQGWSQRVLNGMMEVFNEENYTPIMMYHDYLAQSEARAIRSLIQAQVDAILAIPLEGCEESYDLVLQRNIPLVFFADVVETMQHINYVTWESGEAARLAVRQLIRQGCRRIAYLGANLPTLMTRLRFENYKGALQEAGLTFDQSLVFSQADWHERFLERFRDPQTRPDAVFAQSDSYGIELMEFLLKNGARVPQDVRIMGMGDIHEAGLEMVGLSTMREPCEEIGRESALMALRMVKDPSYCCQKRIIMNDFKNRRTTGGQAV